MLRRLAVLIALLAAMTGVLPAQTGQLEASKTLFVVLAAINAAGYDAGLDSPASHPLRKAVREEIARRRPPVVAEIRNFMRQHRQQDDTWELRQYISYALLVTDPPEFEWRLKEYQLPPDVAVLKDLAPLVRKFYREAGLEELWQQAQPAFDAALERNQPSAIRAINEVSAYLRAPLGGTFMGRQFKVVIDLLGAPNQIHFRTFLDDYFLVVTPSPEPQFNDIRQAYLHYLLDPLVTRFGEKIDEKKALGDYAQGAPYLPEHYKQDFLLLFTKSLIRAIEARLAPAAVRQAMVESAMGEGYILTAHFAEQLPAYEKQEQAMRMYFPELISSIDLAREERRMANFEFSTARPERKAKPAPAAPAPAVSEAERLLAEAEELYTARKLDPARETYARVISMTREKAVQGRAYYGLARIAALRKDPELAVQLFERALEFEVPPPEAAWSLVYLGRLAGAAGDADEAERRFRAALGVEGASPKAREAAEQGLQSILARKDNLK